MSVKVYGEVLLPNTCLWIKKDEKALQLQHLVAVNESFIAMLGLRFYDQTDVQAGGLIRRWQFKGEILEAYSPYAFSEILSVSSREILGVRHYTTEVCQSNYAYWQQINYRYFAQIAIFFVQIVMLIMGLIESVPYLTSILHKKLYNFQNLWAGFEY